MRVNLKGVASATKVLADGTKRKYFYAWRGGPLLRGPDGAPIESKDDPFIHVAFTDAHRERKKPPEGNMAALIRDFQASSDFQKLSDGSQRAYRSYFALIEKRFGKMPLAAIEDRRARGDFKKFRDNFADKPRKADYVWQTLSRILSVAKDNGRIEVNVCERGGRLYDVDRTEIIWQPDDIERFLGAASEEMKLALLLALWTGQRQGDLLRLTWNAYDGQKIVTKQSKTGARVSIPVGNVLRAALETAKTKRNATTILTNRAGKPWTSDGFRASWRKACEAVGLSAGLRFHDLRGTAVTRLATAGCTVAEIASFTGHSMRDAEAILQAHYLGGQTTLAEAAILKLEKHERRTKAANRAAN